jgi:uncharacterized protein
MGKGARLSTTGLPKSFYAEVHSPNSARRSGEITALISVPLFAEYEAVLARRETQRRCPLTLPEQTQLFDAFLARTQIVEVYYRWRPNLPDEGDNHVLELAVAAGNAPIVTFNRRDFRGGELRFPGILVQTPGAWL